MNFSKGDIVSESRVWGAVAGILPSQSRPHAGMSCWCASARMSWRFDASNCRTLSQLHVSSSVDTRNRNLHIESVDAKSDTGVVDLNYACTLTRDWPTCCFDVGLKTLIGFVIHICPGFKFARRWLSFGAHAQLEQPW